MTNYTIAEFLTRLNIANKISNYKLIFPFSNQILAILIILQTLGILKFTIQSSNFYIIINKNGFSKITIISKPSRRVYKTASQIRTIEYGLGTSIIRTSQGIKTVNQARIFNLGGELLCNII